MYTEEELFQKLEKADAAGDTEAAKVIADEIRNIRNPEMSGVEKLKNVGLAIAEPALAFGSGALLAPLSGIAGLGAMGWNALGGDAGNPGDVVREVQSWGYEPKSDAGMAEYEFLSAPFRYIGEKSYEIGDRARREVEPVLGADASKAYGALTEAMLMTSPAMIGLKNPYKSGNVSKKILSEVTEGRRPQIIDALKSSDNNMTAGQAIVPARSTETAALFKSAEGHKPSDYYRIGKAMEESRLGRLENIAKTPEERAFMERIRNGVADKSYTAARSGSFSANDVTSIVNRLDSIIENNPGNPKLLTELKRVRRGFIDRDGNIRTDAQQVLSSVDGIKQALETNKPNMAKSELNQTMNDILDLSGKYRTAERRYAEMSRPINQMNTADELAGALRRRASDANERASSYSTALANEKRTIASATDKKSKATTFEQQMSPEQINTIETIGKELGIDAEYSKQAALGMNKMQNITGDISNIPKAHILERGFVILNSILKRIEGRMSRGGMEEIARLGKPENRAELIKILEELSAEERKILTDYYSEVGKAGVIAGAQEEK